MGLEEQPSGFEERFCGNLAECETHNCKKISLTGCLKRSAPGVKRSSSPTCGGTIYKR
jgi:hypothetical protein